MWWPRVGGGELESLLTSLHMESAVVMYIGTVVEELHPPTLMNAAVEVESLHLDTPLPWLAQAFAEEGAAVVVQQTESVCPKRKLLALLCSQCLAATADSERAAMVRLAGIVVSDSLCNPS